MRSKATAMKTPSCSVNIKEPCARRRAWILRLRVKCLPLVDRWWTWKWTGGGALEPVMRSRRGHLCRRCGGEVEIARDVRVQSMRAMGGRGRKRS